LNKIKIKNTIDYLWIVFIFLNFVFFLLSNGDIAFLFIGFLFIVLYPLVSTLVDRILYRTHYKERREATKSFHRFMKGQFKTEDLEPDSEPVIWEFGGSVLLDLKSKEKGDIVIRDESKTLTGKGSERID